MHIVKMCEAYGWTYEQYMNQPNWFIDLLRGKHSRDLKVQAKRLKKG